MRHRLTSLTVLLMLAAASCSILDDGLRQEKETEDQINKALKTAGATNYRVGYGPADWDSSDSRELSVGLNSTINRYLKTLSSFSDIRRLELCQLWVNVTGLLNGQKCEISSASKGEVEEIVKEFGPGLKIHESETCDLTWLVGLPLTTLILHEGFVDSLRPVGQITTLRRLILDDIQVSDNSASNGSFLVGLTNLNILGISGISVADIECVRHFAIEYLYLDNARIEDISCLREMPLKHLHLRGSEVVDLAPLADSKIEQLDIGHTRVSCLEPLRNVPLEILRMEDCCDLSAVVRDSGGCGLID